MNAADWLVGTVMAHLCENAALDPLRVFDFAPARRSHPWAQIEDPVLAAADAAGVLGRVGTIAVQCRDAGERPTRLRFLVGRLEDEMDRLPAEPGDGWRLTDLALSQSRLVRTKEEWVSRSVWAVRMHCLH